MRERNILRLHHGLQGSSPVSLKDVADLYGISHERTRKVRALLPASSGLA